MWVYAYDLYKLKEYTKEKEMTTIFDKKRGLGKKFLFGNQELFVTSAAAQCLKDRENFDTLLDLLKKGVHTYRGAWFPKYVGPVTQIETKDGNEISNAIEMLLSVMGAIDDKSPGMIFAQHEDGISGVIIPSVIHEEDIEFITKVFLTGLEVATPRR